MLPELKFDDAYIDDMLNRLQTETGYVWDLTPSKVLSQISPGGTSCGFSLGDATGFVYGGPAWPGAGG